VTGMQELPLGSRASLYSGKVVWRSALLGSAVVAILAPFSVFAVVADSMERTYHRGDIVAVARVGYLIGNPWIQDRVSLRGRVIVFRSPVDRDTLVVKRVIAVPGDRVRIDRGTVVLNETPQVESYALRSGESWPLMGGSLGGQAVAVPKRWYFVLGDNRKVSLDSRAWGFISDRAIVGVVVAVLRRGRSTMSGLEINQF